MFQRIIRCPILFFDMNPIGMYTVISIMIIAIFLGRILNRFTRDIASMDTELATNIPDVFEVDY